MLFLKNILVLQHSNYMFDLYIDAIKSLYFEEGIK